MANNEEQVKLTWSFKHRALWTKTQRESYLHVQLPGPLGSCELFVCAPGCDLVHQDIYTQLTCCSQRHRKQSCEETKKQKFTFMWMCINPTEWTYSCFHISVKDSDACSYHRLPPGGDTAPTSDAFTCHLPDSLIQAPQGKHPSHFYWLLHILSSFLFIHSWILMCGCRKVNQFLREVDEWRLNVWTCYLFYHC